MRIRDLGLIPYHEAEELQLKTLAEVLGGGEETLFLLEHPPVVTLGRQGGGEYLHVSEAHLRSQGIELVRTRRGGKITCHFPGQLVAYPIMRVEKRPGGIRRFFADMEEAVIRTAAEFGVAAQRREGYPGVWTAAGKLCSMGIGVRHFVTYHGLALNVGRDVSLFGLMTLCGIADASATSLSAEAGRDISVKEVKDVLAREFSARFAHPALAADQAAHRADL
jgi:lipoyl(octanoyl) transferase